MNLLILGNKINLYPPLKFWSVLSLQEPIYGRPRMIFVSHAGVVHKFTTFAVPLCWYVVILPLEIELSYLKSDMVQQNHTIEEKPLKKIIHYTIRDWKITFHKGPLLEPGKYSDGSTTHAQR